MSVNKGTAGDFAEYLQNVVKLEALEKITQNLDEELADSQRVMKEIQIMFNTLPKELDTFANEQAKNQDLRQEDLSKFLDAGVPKLLMPDMVETPDDVDLNTVIAAMKQYAEDLKKNFLHAQPQPYSIPKQFEKLDLEQYASTLDQLGKRLTNIKLTKRDDDNEKNPQLETKLSQLCQDVDMFTQMVQAKTTLSETNQTWTGCKVENNALNYDNIINKLLSGINEVTYLLQNRN